MQISKFKNLGIFKVYTEKIIVNSADSREREASKKGENI